MPRRRQPAAGATGAPGGGRARPGRADLRRRHPVPGVRGRAGHPAGAGAVGFYGRPSLVLDAVGDMRHPLLLLVAGADRATPTAEFTDLDARLTDAGVEHAMIVYDGAPHSFFDRSYADWHDAGQDAWRRILTFVDTHSTGVVTP